MTKGLRILFLSTLLVLLVAGGLWMESARLLDRVVRPWLIKQAAVELNAQVRLDQLSLTNGRLVLTGLSLERPREFSFSVTTVDVQFTWFGLLKHQVDKLVIREPQLNWSATENDETRDEQKAWRKMPPVQITAWSVENGRAQLQWGGRQLRVGQLMAEGGLGRQFPFAIEARIGNEPGVPLRVAGKVNWEDVPLLSLDEFFWKDKNLLAQPLLITADTGLSNGVRLEFEKLDDSDAAVLLEALGEPLPWPENLHWQLTESGIDFSLEDGHLASRLSTGPGFLQLSGKRWPWHNLELQVKGSFEQLKVTGSLGLAGSASLELDGTWDGQQLHGEWDVSVAHLSKLLQSVGMAIPAAVVTPQGLKLHGTIEAAPDKIHISEAHLVASLGTQGRLEGDVRGGWQTGQLTLLCDRLMVTTVSGNHLVEGSLSVIGNPSAEDWQGNWSLMVNDGARLANISGFPLADGLPNLQDLSMQGKLQWRDGQLRLPGISLAGRLIGPEASGSLHGKLELKTTPAIDLAVLLDSLTLDALEFQTVNGMTGLSGGSLKMQGQLNLIGKRLSFDLSGQAGVSEALVQSWYGKLADLPLRFSAKGSWFGDQQRFELTVADFDLAGLVSSHCSGSYSDKGTSLQALIHVPRLQGAFQQTLQNLTGELLPDIKHLSMAGGLQLAGSLLTDGDRWSLDLQLTPVDVDLKWGQTAQIDKLHGQLPIHLRNYSPATDEPSEAAALVWSGLQTSLVKTGPGRLDLLAAPNRWRQVHPLELTVAGGTARLTSLQLDVPDLLPQLQASLELIDIGLVQVSRALEWPEMGGQLSAKLEEIHVSSDEIKTAGVASVQAFDGDFAIHNMRVEAPFSRFPTYHADVDFSGVDLYRLTNTFEFGEMNGIIDGYIHELRLFDGIPSAFKAKLETRDEGTRNISVKAIRNLNTLSQGGLSAALSQGIYRFIDFYRYRKIGILCSLQNDLFHLEGTGRPDSNQHLIYGGLLPPRIDVVVSSSTISFKEMVRRLKRIERAER